MNLIDRLITDAIDSLIMVAPQDKLYQVFISSTYTDLIEERRGAIEAVLSTNCIPTGMELFPASDGDPLVYIKNVIDYCDFYVLIISGRYGTIREDTGKSYTEEEYEYAVSKGKTVLVFINESVENITPEDIASVPEKEKIKQFVEKASKGRHRRTWNTPDKLKLEIVLALSDQRRTGSAVGWIRADQGNSSELMSKYIALVDENTKLKEENAYLKSQNNDSDFIDRLLNDDLTKPEMVIIRKILQKDCATVNLGDFFIYYEDGGRRIEDYTESDISTSMMQLDKMGVGQASMYYSTEEVDRFVLNDREFRLIRKSKEVREKLGV